ncbi:hypothetical protein AKO1_011044 [Acrasis kona]|uniref:Uncharacterized protein n=1 Tax=Acrasis kona TaxID=1008807 RepID=A0AAW2YSV0_9EUKA
MLNRGHRAFQTIIRSSQSGSQGNAYSILRNTVLGGNRLLITSSTTTNSSITRPLRISNATSAGGLPFDVSITICVDDDDI